MMEFQNSPVSLEKFFETVLLEVCGDELCLKKSPEMTAYLAKVMSLFARQEGLYPFSDESGRPILNIGEMLEYGDIRLKARSFDQERIVHRHVGNLMLFATAFFPQLLTRLGFGYSASANQFAFQQGTHSYLVASTFDFPPYKSEAQVLRSLSTDFESFSLGLAMLRSRLPGFNLGLSNCDR